MRELMRAKMQMRIGSSRGSLNNGQSADLERSTNQLRHHHKQGKARQRRKPLAQRRIDFRESSPTKINGPCGSCLVGWSGQSTAATDPMAIRYCCVKLVMSCAKKNEWVLSVMERILEKLVELMELIESCIIRKLEYYKKDLIMAIFIEEYEWVLEEDFRKISRIFNRKIWIIKKIWLTLFCGEIWVSFGCK